MPIKPRRILLAWSGGKDSAWAHVVLARDPAIALCGLLTTTRDGDAEVVMHRTPCSALRAQADALGLPLWEVALPDPCPNAVYEARMAEVVARARAERITAIAFGDLFLADIRAYRERTLQGTGIEPIFPLWGEDTAALARTMIDAGLRAHLVAVDLARLSSAFLGLPFDRALLAALPPDVDPCGEHGEFHTLVTGGPGFARPIDVGFAGSLEVAGHAYARVQHRQP